MTTVCNETTIVCCHATVVWCNRNFVTCDPKNLACIWPYYACYGVTVCEIGQLLTVIGSLHAEIGLLKSRGDPPLENNGSFLYITGLIQLKNESGLVCNDSDSIAMNQIHYATLRMLSAVDTMQPVIHGDLVCNSCYPVCNGSDTANNGHISANNASISANSDAMSDTILQFLLTTMQFQ